MGCVLYYYSRLMVCFVFASYFLFHFFLMIRPPPKSTHYPYTTLFRSKRSSPNVFEMAATETITSIILIKLIRVSLGTVRHPRRFKIVVIDIQITLKQMLRDFIGIRV